MKMTQLEIAGPQPPIDGYAPSGFRIAGVFHEGAVVLSAAGAAPWVGAAQGLARLDSAAAAPLAALKGEIDVLLIGFGADVAAAPDAFRAALAPLEAAAEGFGVDIMGTPAACRTYNILLAESRRVAAALLPVGGAA